MARLDSFIDNKIAQNIFIWFCFFLIMLSAVQSENKILTVFYAILLLAPAIYINNILILPFLKKNNIWFILLFISNILMFSFIAVFSINQATAQEFKWDMYLNFLSIMLLAIAFGTAIKFARDSFLRRQQEQEAELKLLKAQLNPHFLFNTLNNLYGLSLIKSDELPRLMLKLSDLLRYSLYETKETLVPLVKEISYLENYISLEKIRLEDKTNIKFIKTGDLSSVKIAPMLLIIFVENAFKHVGSDLNGQGKVAIAIHAANKQITFSCENSIENPNDNEENLEKGSSGIGLENAKKRLKLLYPEKHQLKICRLESSFSVQLTLDL